MSLSGGQVFGLIRFLPVAGRWLCSIEALGQLHLEDVRNEDMET